MNTSVERPTILRSYLGRMRGLGTGHNIFEHWWTERITAAGSAPLSIWFIIQILAVISILKLFFTASASK